MKKTIIFFMFLIGINITAHLGYPCSTDEKKCVLRGFRIDGKEVNKAEKKDFKEIVDLVNQYGIKGSIDIVGHTDSTGSEKYNLKLSLIRAKKVAELMREYGLDKRFSFGKIIGRGESSPSNTNETVEGRYNNRRVEIFLGNVEFETLKK